MRTLVVFSLSVAAILVASSSPSAGRGGGAHFGGGGLGGGGFRGGDFGGDRSAFNRTPSFSFPRNNAFEGRGGGEFGGDRPSFDSLDRGGQFSQGRAGEFFSPSNIARDRDLGGAGAATRPGLADRTANGLRPGGADRPLARPAAGDRPFNRPGDGQIGRNAIDHGNWHHGNWHDHWDHRWNRWPAGWWGWGLGWGAGYAMAALPWTWGYSSYYNPYYVVQDGGYNYGQPILASAPADQPADAQTTSVDEASQLFDAARQAFLAGDYDTALAKDDQAIAKVPNDPNLHEFRALALFALGRYPEASAVIYDVLSSGPGWDWTTLIGLYPNVDTYTKQLRALEAYCRENPRSADARFLLAYEYLTCGETSAAAAELKDVVRLNPRDQLSEQLLAALVPADNQSPDTSPQPSTPAAAPAGPPVTAAYLEGSWSAKRPDGGSIGLNLSKDSTYTWKYSHQGQDQTFHGTYSVADNLLILNEDKTPAMVGQVSLLPDKSFNFKLAGGSPSDPGLTFTR